MEKRLPDKVYTLLTLHEPPPSGMPIPVIVHPAGEGAILVFGEKEPAEEFMASPGMDVPAIIHEVSLGQLIELLKACVRLGAAKQVIVDPSPPHRWGTGDEAGEVYPADVMAKLLEEIGD